MNSRALIAVIVVLGLAASLQAQDSVDVTFRWTVSGSPSGVSVPGEFNSWNNAAWIMTYEGGGLWTRTARLRVNPTGVSIPGAYQYKFYYNGVSPWPNDPLNHHVNVADNDNSFIIVRNPTIYHFLPNQRSGTVITEHPVISAYIFPRVGTVVDTSSLSLSVDGVMYNGVGAFYNFAAKQFSFPLPTALPDGNHVAILTAGASRDTVSFIVQVGGPPVVPMPVYARHAVTLPSPQSNDSTTFRIRTGGTNYMLVRIAPVGQPVASMNPLFMRKNPGTDDWWINVRLPAGTYEYQYQNDNGAMFHDPWGRYNGTYGSRFTIGPEGLSADDYVWGSTGYIRPSPRKLIIYELNVGEFAGGYFGLPGGQAGFSHLISLLPYFDSLGINAIELMPINDFGLVGRSGHGWGYDLNTHFALEPGYGSPRDFKRLVDSAHARGIAIIVDVVYNHLNDTGPLWQMQPDVVASPYFKANNDLRYNEDPLFFFRDMDHWTDEMQEYVYESLKMWLDVYRVDGFRYDLTQGIGWNINEPTRGILGWANRIDQEYNGMVYQIAEHLPESPALLFYSGITSGWHDSFRDEIFDEARFRNTTLQEFDDLILDLGAYPGNDTPALPNRYADRTGPVNASVNHDEQSLIYEMTTFQGVSLSEAIQRDKLYATFIFTSLGIPMLWQGMEFSAPRGWMNDGQKLSYRPVEWNLYPTMRGQSHYAYYKALIQQRKHNPALNNGSLRRLFRYNAEKTLVWGYEDAASGAKVMAVANLSGTQRTVTNVPWLAAGAWYDIWTQDVFNASSTTVDSLTIAAYSARVYSNIPDSLLLDAAPATTVPERFALHQNYPNPFNPSTTISFALAERSQVTITVFDLLGRRVAIPVTGTYEAGSHEAHWRGIDERGLALPSGGYLYRMTTDRGLTFVKKMVLLK